MHTRTIAALALTAACIASPSPPHGGKLNLCTGAHALAVVDPFRIEMTRMPSEPEEVEDGVLRISNRCGVFNASLRVTHVVSGALASPTVEIEGSLGEWCRMPFSIDEEPLLIWLRETDEPGLYSGEQVLPIFTAESGELFVPMPDAESYGLRVQVVDFDPTRQPVVLPNKHLPEDISRWKAAGYIGYSDEWEDFVWTAGAPLDEVVRRLRGQSCLPGASSD